jgi:hypothetical protein
MTTRCRGQYELPISNSPLRGQLSVAVKLRFIYRSQTPTSFGNFDMCTFIVRCASIPFSGAEEVVLNVIDTRR